MRRIRHWRHPPFFPLIAMRTIGRNDEDITLASLRHDDYSSAMRRIQAMRRIRLQWKRNHQCPLKEDSSSTFASSFDFLMFHASQGDLRLLTLNTYSTTSISQALYTSQGYHRLLTLSTYTASISQTLYTSQGYLRLFALYKSTFASSLIIYVITFRSNRLILEPSFYQH